MTNVSIGWARVPVLAIILALAFLAGGKTQASFFGNNGRIIFNTYANDSDHLYTIDGDGNHVTDFGSDSGDSPAWSADGSRIAFTHYMDNEFQEDIFVMNSDGSGAMQITSKEGTDGDPAWTPDGRILFASDRDGDFDIYVMDADGDNLMQLTDDPSLESGPVVSPDGKQIAYGSDAVDGYQIWLMGANGESPEQLTSMPGYTNAAEWSPDGSIIAFYSNDSDNFDVYTIKPDGSDLTRLTTDPQRDASPAWSPDGSAIAFMSRRDNPPDCKDTDNCTDAIFVMNADGSNQHLLFHVGDTGGPDWQAVGKSGDTDCDEDVDAVDGLFDLRYVAALSHPLCVFAVGDVDCDGDIDAVDALLILRQIAGLPVNLPAGCREIAT